MLHDPWLDRWLPTLVDRARDSHVLEIGCGHGDDTSTLIGAGLNVLAFDLSNVSVAIARTCAPAAKIECRDVRSAFPTEAQNAGAVIASLSLHYFPWDETLLIVQRIRQILRPKGLLLCRLNSTEDHNFGAKGHQQIEPNFFMVENQPKRFFNKEAVSSLFNSGWKQLSLEHSVTRKYVKAKTVWEVALERDA